MGECFDEEGIGTMNGEGVSNRYADEGVTNRVTASDCLDGSETNLVSADEGTNNLVKADSGCVKVDSGCSLVSAESGCGC